MTPSPAPDAHELARLQLEALHQLTRATITPEPERIPLPADPQAALAQLTEYEREAARPYQGALGELARLLQTEKPDILGEINAARTKKRTLWQRIRLTLGLD
jgi:hypothetical protein